jgi:uncharacterized protein (TIGR02996 family)
MTHEEAFLRDICEHPFDDAPRLVYADWLDDQGGEAQRDRAEFIRGQIELTRPDCKEEHAEGLYRRHVELLNKHTRSWLGPLATPSNTGRNAAAHLLDQPGDPHAFYKANGDGSARFRRGFVDQVAMSSMTYLARRQELLGPHPVTALILADGREAVSALAECPLTSRLEKLQMWAAWLRRSDLEALGKSVRLTNLRFLSLGGSPLPPQEVGALANGTAFSNLRSLRLSGCGLTARSVRRLARSACWKQLTVLHLDNNHLRDPGAIALAKGAHPERPETLYLQDCAIGDAGAVALANCPRLASLKRLYFHGQNLLGPEGVEAIANSPYLTGLVELHIQPAEDQEECLTRLAKSPSLNNLERLVLSGQIPRSRAWRKLHQRFGTILRD